MTFSLLVAKYSVWASSRREAEEARRGLKKRDEAKRQERRRDTLADTHCLPLGERAAILACV